MLLALVMLAGAPVNLECTIPAKDGPRLWKFALDEDAGVAPITYPVVPLVQTKLSPKTTPATFTADEVHFHGFVVNRVTLNVRNLRGGVDGTCVVANVSNRAF